MSDLLRSTWLLAVLGLVIAGIRVSCAAVPATLRLFPALLSFHGPAAPGKHNTRVDERSTRDFAFYLAFGHAGLCRGRNP
jgi:hypothetical protein